MIWKWPLESLEDQIIMVPVGTKIISAQIQDSRICVWGMFDKKQAKNLKKTQVLIVGTGTGAEENLPPIYRFIDTVQHNGFVFHVFVNEVYQQWPTLKR